MLTLSLSLSFEDGTIRIDVDGSHSGLDLPGIEYDPRSEVHRAPAYRYRDLIAALDEREIDYTTHISVPSLDLRSTYELRGYQQNALDAWRENGNRGVLELPTGSGKTVIGIEAIETLSCPTLVVVPTIDLLDQWRKELCEEFSIPIGQLGGGEQRIENITVSTYDSAYLRADAIGDRFGLVIFDEAHHLGGEGYRDIARLLPAPARMGLTATFERPDGAHDIILELIGQLVYSLTVDDLAGEHLAPYDIKRLPVSLSTDERERYEEAQGTFTDYLKRSNLTLRQGSDYQKLVMRSGTDPKAREALLAKQRARDVMMNSDGKVDALATILDRHQDDRIIVFAASTEFVYRLAERFLIPAITHHTDTTERREILDRFRDGRYARVVTANVLDEGVDVPDANVGVVLAGSGSQREFTQRLGRILRPNEDGGRALLYEIVTEETTEERIARRRR